MAITKHNDVLQGSDEWLALRCGVLTASEMKHIITPAKLQYASNEKERGHLYNLVAQRITKYVEPHYIGDDMLRGMEDEITARDLYAKTYAPVETVGFITNDKWGYTLGMSPDGLVGEDGGLECKSRLQKFQIETILADEMPADFMLQVQSALLITERKWWDFVSYCGGLPMFTKRVYPDAVVQAALLDATSLFHGKVNKMLAEYNDKLKSATMKLIPTKRKEPEQEMELSHE